MPTFNFSSDITNGDISGSGVFDLLMKSVKTHLNEEYNASRIRDEDFATVYLGSLQSAMQQAVQYQMGKDQLEINWEKTQVELDLIAQKILTEKGQVENVADGLIGQQQALLDKQNTHQTQETVLLGHKINTELGQVIDMSTGLIGKQQLQLAEETKLVTEKISTEEAQTTDITTGILGRKQAIMTQEVLVAEQEVLVAQQKVLESVQAVQKSIKEVELLVEKINSEKAQTNDEADGILGLQQDLLAKQLLELDAQINLLEAKVATEDAQTQDGADGIMGQMIEKSKAEALLMEAKYLTEQAQTTTAIKKVDGTPAAEFDGYMYEQIEYMKAQAEKMANDSLLTYQKLATEAANTGNTFKDKDGTEITLDLPTGSEEAPITGGLMGQQMLKIIAEKELLAQKKASEEGQIEDMTGGVLGKQQALYEAQKEGFYRDAEQKAAKIVSQAYNIRESTGSNANIPDTLDNEGIDQVLAIMVNGITSSP